MVATPSRSRCLVVWGAGTAVVTALVSWLLLPELTEMARAASSGHLLAQPFDRTLVQVCAVAAAACAGWLWLVTSILIGEALLGRPSSGRGLPARWRRLTLVACGAAVIATTPATSSADDSARHVRGVEVAGLPFPDRATGGPVRPRPVVQTRAADHASVPGDRVVVRSGQSLWRIAEAHLPSGAADALVASHCARLYSLNRDVVGRDPDLIHPGQRLLLPPSRP